MVLDLDQPIMLLVNLQHSLNIVRRICFPQIGLRNLMEVYGGDVAKHICCVALKRELKNVREILEYWMHGYGFCGDGN